MKKYITVGKFVGIFFIVVGLLTLIGCFGSADSFSWAPSEYDYGYATFGTDYYTYSVNNAAYAASAASTGANNIREMSGILQICFGFFFIGIGAIDICGFGIISAKYETVPNIVSPRETNSLNLNTVSAKSMSSTQTTNNTEDFKSVEQPCHNKENNTLDSTESN